MASVTQALYTWSKNRDLHATSALDVLKHQRELTYITQLYRLHYWHIELEAPSLDVANQSINQLVNQTYYLVNTNNSHYQIGNPPDFLTMLPKPYYTAIVSQKKPNTYDALRTTILNRFGFSISVLNQHILWGLKTSVDVSSDDIHSDIFNTQSVQSGLLVNPIYETYELTAHDINN